MDKEELCTLIHSRIKDLCSDIEKTGFKGLLSLEVKERGSKWFTGYFSELDNDKNKELCP